MSPASTAPAAATEQIKTNLDLAWRSHTAQENWTAKVDTKASIIFTVNSAAIGAILALRTQKGSYLEQLGGWREILFTIAITLCGVAAATAGAAVYPMLGRVSKHRSQRGTIYFGHLRHREPADLAAQLERLAPNEHFDQLSHQLTAMAKRNWWKHRILQGALLIAAIGYITIFILVMV